MNYFFISLEKEIEVNRRIEADPEYKKYEASINEQINELQLKKAEKRNEVRSRILKEMQ